MHQKTLVLKLSLRESERKKKKKQLCICPFKKHCYECLNYYFNYLIALIKKKKNQYDCTFQGN